MIAGLKPYRAMRDSGVPWLGEVPEHWEVRKLRQCGSISGGLTPSMADRSLWDGDIPWVTPKDMKRFTIAGASMSVSARALEATSLRLIPSGSVLLVVRGMILARRVPIARTIEPVTINQDMKAIVPATGVDAGYLAYRMDAAQAAFVPMIDEAGHGTKRFPTERWKDVVLAIPPVDEQRRIVRFLDHADRRIRRYIRAKQKLITLLEEQKQAIIHRAVTRGLDPNVRLKPSGVEWLGDVPEHWEINRVRYVFREVDMRSSDGSEQHLSMSQRLGLVPSEAVKNRTLVSESNAGGKLCEVGDLVLNRLKAHLGVFALARHTGVISPDYTVLRPIDVDGVEYFERVLRSPACRHELRTRAKGIVEGFWRLYTDDLYDIRLPVPPPQERKKIVSHFMAETRTPERAALQAEREIALLGELRTRLVADVVTGKLDVREAAARLPDGIEEPEPTDDIEVECDAEEEGGDDAGVVPAEAEP